MTIKSILDFAKMKVAKQSITMLTCYDYCMAQILNETPIDCLLVGDTVSMILHGHKTTVNADMNMLALHVAAVSRGASDKFIIGDLPFLSYRKGIKDTLENIAILMRAGAHAVKLEGVAGQIDTIRHVVESGVPVMGHLGLTPQSIHQLGGFRVQAKSNEEAELLLQAAQALEEAGCFAIVLECVPAQVAAMVTQQLKIPTIGIGAGVDVDGQVLVLHDMLGMNPQFKAKFVKTYFNGFEVLKNSINQYVSDVKDRVFPAKEQSY